MTDPHTHGHMIPHGHTIPTHTHDHMIPTHMVTWSPHTWSHNPHTHTHTRSHLQGSYPFSWRCHCGIWSGSQCDLLTSHSLQEIRTHNNYNSQLLQMALVPSTKCHSSLNLAAGRLSEENQQCTSVGFLKEMTVILCSYGAIVWPGKTKLTALCWRTICKAYYMESQARSYNLMVSTRAHKNGWKAYNSNRSP